MAHRNNDNKLDAVMEMLIENGFESFADVLRILLNEAMKIERDQALGAQLYERTQERRGYANGYKPKTVGTRVGKLCVDVPQVRGDVDFYPSALEKGCRSERALKLAIAEMYVKGVSTRRVTDVLEKMCGLDISSTQVSRVAGILDEQLSKWRDRLLAVDDSFEQSSRKIEVITGQKVSDNTIERVVCQVGSVAQGQQNQQLQRFFEDKQIPQSQTKPERLYVAVDGTTVHETDGWHEGKIGVVYFEDERKQRKSFYVGRFDNSETFGWHLWLEACKYGYLEAKEVVYLGDGAPWIRTEHNRHFGRATFIIDWYHASEYIWDCGKKLFGEGTKATEKWVKKRLDLLWDGWTKKLLDNLKEQCKKYRGAKRKSLATLIRYVSTNEDQMRYDVFRANGYDIGSSAVEEACKNVIGKRLKQSGMIWTRLGSSSVLALRVSWLNDEWEQLWQKKPLAA